jgi:hypothetical protein
LGLQEIFGAEGRPHESPRLVIAHGQQDMTHFVRQDPSQRAPYVLRTEARATQQASELSDTRGAEEFLGRLTVDVDRHMVNGSKRQVRAPQDQFQRPSGLGVLVEQDIERRLRPYTLRETRRRLPPEPHSVWFPNGSCLVFHRFDNRWRWHVFVEPHIHVEANFSESMARLKER